MSEELFDFGFTAVDESELNVYQEAQQKVAETNNLATASQEKVDTLYKAILPLLNKIKETSIKLN